jgi:hypothetical protein
MRRLMLPQKPALLLWLRELPFWSLPLSKSDLLRRSAEAGHSTKPVKMIFNGVPLAPRAQGRFVVRYQLATLKNWVGTIERLSTNGDGDGVLTVQLADNAHLGTNNNSFSDMTESTLIKSDSSLYRELLIRMKINDPIRFSASLFPNSTDCFREHSVTLGGSLDDPIFVVRFSRVQRVELPAIPGERS